MSTYERLYKYLETTNFDDGFIIYETEIEGDQQLEFQLMLYKNILLSDGDVHARSVFIRCNGTEKYYQFDTAQKPSSDQDMLSLIFRYLRNITANLFNFESEFDPILENPTIKVTVVNEGFYHYKFIPKFDDDHFNYDYDSLGDGFNLGVLKALIYDCDKSNRSTREKYAFVRYLEIYKPHFHHEAYDILFNLAKESLSGQISLLEVIARIRNKNILSQGEQSILSFILERSSFLKFECFVTKDGPLPDWEDFVLNELGEVHAYKPITYKGEEFRICGSFKN